jgi:thioesterase domain-containing protein
VEDIAAHYLSEMRSVQPSGPYFLGGYCFGGMVAFEIAQQLQKQGEAVPLLVFLTSENPQKVRSVSFAGQTTGLSTNRVSVGAKLRPYLRTLKTLEPRQKVTYIFSGVKRKIEENFLHPAKTFTQKIACRLYVGLGYPLPVGLRSRYILEVYDQAVSRYVPGIYSGRVIVFEPAEDFVDPRGWEGLAVDGLEVHEVPGSHCDVVTKEDHVRVWAGQLKAHLASAQSSVRARLS